MKILVYASDYPSAHAPNRGVFVYNLIQKFAILGHDVTVITPSAINKSFQRKNAAQSYGEERAKVYRLSTISTSAVKIGKFNTYEIGQYVTIQQLRRLVKKTGTQYDVIYAHFLTNGLIVERALSYLNIPIFVAMGESNLNKRLSLISPGRLAKSLKKITGFITVAVHLKESLLSLGVPSERIGVFPNGVDLKVFRQMDKLDVRQDLGINPTDKVLIFVGRFLTHKGPDRVIQALSRINKDIKLILVGKGSLNLEFDGIIFKGTLPSYMIPTYLNAADIFILPTQREGASNSIVEAMACGLPIISSNIKEVREQCLPSFSKLVDPLNIEEIARAIESIIDDKEQLQIMSAEARKHSMNFNIEDRAENILEFISRKCDRTISIVEDIRST